MPYIHLLLFLIVSPLFAFTQKVDSLQQSKIQKKKQINRLLRFELTAGYGYAHAFGIGGNGFKINQNIELGKEEKRASFITGLDYEMLAFPIIASSDKYTTDTIKPYYSHKINFPVEVRVTVGKSKPKFFFGFSLSGGLEIINGKHSYMESIGFAHIYHYSSENKVFFSGNLTLTTSLGYRQLIKNKTEIIAYFKYGILPINVFIGNERRQPLSVFSINVGFNFHYRTATAAAKIKS